MDGEKLAFMSRPAELVFRYGQHRCFDKTIILLELNKVFAEVGFTL